jgi:hypothetical protein
VIIEDRFFEKRVVENLDHLAVSSKSGGLERFPNLAPGDKFHADVRGV